jgi:hypothetical protein
MAALLAISKLNRCVSMRVVELAERGARAMPVDLILSHLAEENEARPLQGLHDLDGVDDVVEWCAQIHDGDVRGVLLWEWSVLLLWKKAFERRAHGRGESPPSWSPRAITSTMAPKSLLSLQFEPLSLRGSRTSVTSSGKGLAT